MSRTIEAIMRHMAPPPSRVSPTVCRSECTSSPADLRSQWSCGQVRGRPHREVPDVMVSLPPLRGGCGGWVHCDA